MLAFKRSSAACSSLTSTDPVVLQLPLMYFAATLPLHPSADLSLSDAPASTHSGLDKMPGSFGTAATTQLRWTRVPDLPVLRPSRPARSGPQATSAPDAIPIMHNQHYRAGQPEEARKGGWNGNACAPGIPGAAAALHRQGARDPGGIEPCRRQEAKGVLPRPGPMVFNERDADSSRHCDRLRRTSGRRSQGAFLSRRCDQVSGGTGRSATGTGG